MKTIVISCSTQKIEIMHVVKELYSDLPILWIEAELHNTPEKLHTGLQQQINRIDNVDNILLTFGTCGNALLGLSSPTSRIIFPRVSDCLCLFMGGNLKKKELDDQATSYYFTKGYLDMEQNIYQDYKKSLVKYGPEKTEMIMSTMMNGYVQLNIIDTGAYNVDEVTPITEEFAKNIHLDHKVVNGSLDLIYKAFKGQWDSDFGIIEAGKSIQFEDIDPDETESK